MADASTEIAAHNLAVAATAQARGKKPNILVIWGDDVGISNISAYSDGLMGYTTSHIDRIAKEGVRFLHYYGEQSCTAGRAAFLTVSTVSAPVSPRTRRTSVTMRRAMRWRNACCITSVPASFTTLRTR